MLCLQQQMTSTRAAGSASSSQTALCPPPASSSGLSEIFSSSWQNLHLQLSDLVWPIFPPTLCNLPPGTHPHVLFRGHILTKPLQLGKPAGLADDSAMQADSHHLRLP